MTQEVSDEKLGRFARQQNDWFRRVREGSLDPDEVACAIQQIIDRRPLERIKVDIFNAYRCDLREIQRDVMRYVYLVIGLDGKRDKDGFWEYVTLEGKRTKLYIDERYINAVEERLNFACRESKKVFYCEIRKIFAMKCSDPNYDFMEHPYWLELSKAITDVRLQSDIARAGSLHAALKNRTDEENLEIYHRIIKGLIKQGYSEIEAQEAIERYCAKSK